MAFSPLHETSWKENKKEKENVDKEIFHPIWLYQRTEVICTKYSIKWWDI